MSRGLGRTGRGLARRASQAPAPATARPAAARPPRNRLREIARPPIPDTTAQKLAGPRASGQVDIERREGNSEQRSNWLPLVGALSPRFRQATNREEGGGIGALR